MNKSKETTWIMNPHGVKVALPKWRAAERVNNFPGYKYCEPDEVPEVKQYPLEGELTEQGERRRIHRQERANAGAKNTTKKVEKVKTEPEGDKSDRLLTVEEYEALPFLELKSYAKSRGIDVKKDTKKNEILTELKKGQGV